MPNDQISGLGTSTDYPDLQSDREHGHSSAISEKAATESYRPKVARTPRREIVVIGGYADDKDPENHGVHEIASVVKILDAAEIPCCIIDEGALIYYGTHRIMFVSEQDYATLPYLLF
jgi:hypothetical protein